MQVETEWFIFYARSDINGLSFVQKTKKMGHFINIKLLTY